MFARGHRLEGRANHLGVRGEPGIVVRRCRLLVATDAIRQFQHQELAEQVGTIGFSPVILEARPRFAPASRLEAITDQLDPSDDRGRKALVVSWSKIAHVGASSDHTFRIDRSLRSTVCGTHPSLSAISWLVYPSIFQRATVRSEWSGSRARSR